ncbi:hypothetical protein C8J56DRAFT_471320 [Mycena floridula]|nr:hypothetical protein C8J56DRAFT_471320 [Mycena floridula]
MLEKQRRSTTRWLCKCHHLFSETFIAPQHGLCAGIKDPESYSDLLRFRHVFSWKLVNPYHLNDEKYFSGFSDDRMCRFLDTIARLVVSRLDQVAAVTASRESVENSLHTTIYVAFSRDPEELDSIADSPSEVTFPTSRLDPGKILIDKANGWICWDLSRAIHGFSFDRLMSIINEYQEALQQASQAVAEDRVWY